MAVNLSPVGGVAAQFFDNNGVILSGGKIYTYTAGTTTNATTYTSATGGTAHSNPIILDSAGRVPSGEIWLTDGLQYKFVIKNSNDVLIGTYDNIVGINSNFVNFVADTEIQTATAGQTVFTLTTMEYQPGTNNLTVYVDGVNQYDGVSYAYVETDATTVTFTAGLHVGALVKFTTVQTLSNGVTDSSLVTYDPPFNDSVPTNVEDKLAQTVSVKDFGATGDGSTDDAASIQAAIDSGASTIFFPSGVYRIESCLDLTDRPVSSPIALVGDGAPFGGIAPSASSKGTTIVGYTDNWMIDCTGSSFISIENMLLYGETSKGGILNARSAAGQYAIYVRYVKLYVYIKTSPSFTTAGSIALFGDCTENQVVDQCWFEADTAYVTTLDNEVGAVSVYSTIVSSPASNTDVLHSQTVYKGITGASILAYGLASSTFEQCFWQKATPSNTYSHAIVLQDSANGYQTCQKINFTGQAEDYDYAFLLDGDTTNININITTAAVNTAFVRLTAATNHYGLNVNVQAYTRAANKRVLDSTTTTAANVYGGNIVVADGGKLDSTYVKYIGTTISMPALDTHNNAVFNYASGSTYSLMSLTTPLFGSFTFSPGTVVNGASFGAGSNTVTNANLGDWVTASANIDLEGCSLSAYVAATNSVTIVLTNNSGTNKTFTPFIVKVKVAQS